jgi:uncharacterized membrane protein
MASSAENSEERGSLTEASENTPDIAVIEPKLEQIVERKIQVAMRMESGPMPSPENLAQYDKIVPGCARMIVEEFKANSQHSRAMDLLGINGMIRRDARAQWMAFVLMLAGLWTIWELASNGRERTAIAVATVLIGSVVVAFLTGHSPWAKKNDADREEPDKESD